MKSIFQMIIASLFTLKMIMASLLFSSSIAMAEDTMNHDKQTIRVPAFTLPVSSLMNQDVSEPAADNLSTEQLFSDIRTQCPPEDLTQAELSKLPDIRRCRLNAFYKSTRYHSLIDRYPVLTQSQSIDGVVTDTVTPDGGVPAENQDKVLINLHGGAFQIGSRYIGLMESIPIASLARIKVVTVDYRMAPEHHFPAASEDVARVYRSLLKHYKPENIGIFGCSAGAMLTAQSIAWFQQEKLPLPAAIAMQCAAASPRAGDSIYVVGAITGNDYSDMTWPYFEHADMANPMVLPALSAKVLSNFPPSLLVSSTRDDFLSSVIHTHRQLINVGVRAELHLWEGLGHGFLLDPSLPEAREVYKVTVDFFSTWLGRSGQQEP